MFGFEWDGSVDFQSSRNEDYAAALSRLQAAGLCYACCCSRATLAASQLVDPGSEPVYGSTCRANPQARAMPHALRFAIDAGQAPLEFKDAIQGACRQDCRREAGDFIVRRRDGIYAYHLAVVVDDARSGVTEVIRGADLLSSTPRQILLQRALGLPTPRYGHLPVLVEADGRKLAKSRRALPLSADAASRDLWRVLEFLAQSPPLALAHEPAREIWAWAIANWQPGRFAGVRERRLPPAVPA